MDPIAAYSQLENLYFGKNKLNLDPRAASWFPLYPSEKLAGLVADLMGDGHLQGNPKWRFDYCSGSEDELYRFEESVVSLFGVKGKIRKCTANKYGTMNYGVNCRSLAKTLFLIGVPTGNKVIRNYPIPSWILVNKEFFSSFVRRYFDCEASVDVRFKAISVEQWKSKGLAEGGNNFLRQIKNGLKEYFDIDSTNPFVSSRAFERTYGATVHGIRLKIKNRKNLRKFYECIGFDSKNKMAKLKLAIA